MKLIDKMNGPEWVMWVEAGIFILLTIIFLSGHGSGLIAGYNTASKEEQEQYDKKKLCRVMGFGMAVISICIIVMGLFETVLPASFVYVFLGIVIVDIIAIIVLSNTVCRK